MPTFLGLKPDPDRGRLQCNNQAIEKEVEAVTIAPCRPNVVESDGRSAGGACDSTSAAEVYDGALCSFSSCDATITYPNCSRNLSLSLCPTRAFKADYESNESVTSQAMSKVAYDDIRHRHRRFSLWLRSVGQPVNPAVWGAYYEFAAETSTLLEEQSSASTLPSEYRHPCPRSPGANCSRFRPLLHKKKKQISDLHTLTSIDHSHLPWR